MSLLNTLLKTDNVISFAAPWDVQEPKNLQLQGGFAPLTPPGALPPDPRYRLALHALAMAPATACSPNFQTLPTPMFKCKMFTACRCITFPDWRHSAPLLLHFCIRQFVASWKRGDREGQLPTLKFALSQNCRPTVQNIGLKHV